MKSLWAITLLLGSSVLTAAEPVDVWACRGIGASGFNWHQDHWKFGRFEDGSLLLTLAGDESSVKFDGYDWPLLCTTIVTNGMVSCHYASVGYMLMLNPETGQAARSYLYGGVVTDIDQRDSVSLELFQCERF